MKAQTKLVLFAVIAWLFFALAVGVGGWFRQASAIGVAATLWGLAIAALLVCGKAPAIRDWCAEVDLRWLIALHLTRFVGIYFLFLAKWEQLPVGFAQPAGIGDIAVATLAWLILILRPLHKIRVVFIWNLLGVLDILFVVFSALRFGLLDWKSMAPLRELPLSLLPTFFVPLIIVTHVIIFVRLRMRRK